MKITASIPRQAQERLAGCDVTTSWNLAARGLARAAGETARNHPRVGDVGRTCALGARPGFVTSMRVVINSCAGLKKRTVRSGVGGLPRRSGSG